MGMGNTKIDSHITNTTIKDIGINELQTDPADKAYTIFGKCTTLRKILTLFLYLV